MPARAAILLVAVILLTYHDGLATLVPTRHDAAAAFGATAKENADDARDDRSVLHPFRPALPPWIVPLLGKTPTPDPRLSLLSSKRVSPTRNVATASGADALHGGAAGQNSDARLL
jgi:hypothetical protein